MFLAILGVADGVGRSAVTAIDTSVASVTVSVSMPVIVAPPADMSFAEMTVVPWETAVAVPIVAPVVEIVAVAVVAEAQVT